MRKKEVLMFILIFGGIGFVILLVAAVFTKSTLRAQLPGYYQSDMRVDQDLIAKEEYVPEQVKWSVISSEQENFYQNKSVFECLAQNIFQYSECENGRIASQVIRRTVNPKNPVIALLLTNELEDVYTKDEILKMYLNTMPVGFQKLGIKTGANIYFDKSLEELTLAEIAILNGVSFHPTVDNNKLDLSIMKKRSDFVLDSMASNLENINNRIETVSKEITYPVQKKISTEDIENAKKEINDCKLKAIPSNYGSSRTFYYDF